ncbi:MAG: hypothetical protein IJ385_00130 [Ruminiclostridium sp.]|nr:hypothetical protein [Ruminiclostridium sp.]
MNSDGCIQSVPYLESAAEITPAGIMIEPYGEHSFSELKKHYSQQAEMRSDAPAFLLKGMTLMSDLRAGLLACRKTKKSVYAVINVNEDLQTANELPADAALITLQSMGLAAFGISAANDEILMDGICRLASFAKIPVLQSLTGRLPTRSKARGLPQNFMVIIASAAHLRTTAKLPLCLQTSVRHSFWSPTQQSCPSLFRVRQTWTKFFVMLRTRRMMFLKLR